MNGDYHRKFRDRGERFILMDWTLGNSDVFGDSVAGVRLLSSVIVEWCSDMSIEAAMAATFSQSL
jgi:hypothetical protein